MKAMRIDMAQFQPRDPEYAARVHASFALQHAMELIGARLMVVEPGFTSPRSTCLSSRRSPSSTVIFMAVWSA